MNSIKILKLILIITFIFIITNIANCQDINKVIENENSSVSDSVITTYPYIGISICSLTYYNLIFGFELPYRMGFRLIAGVHGITFDLTYSLYKGKKTDFHFFTGFGSGYPNSTYPDTKTTFYLVGLDVNFKSIFLKAGCSIFSMPIEGVTELNFGALASLGLIYRIK
ncbi:MAG: hypothetical protein QG635_264 [Bacteroidota bacterium]|nr:hypothetical protein [Bacteroidota bacterium]